MADRNNGSGDELFDTADDSVTTPVVDDTKETHDVNSEGEQLQDDLDLEDNTEDKGNTSKAEEAKNKQLDAWSKKINSGKATLDDLPANLQWLKSDLKQMVTVKKEVETVNVKELVKREIQEAKDAARFDAYKEELDSALDSEQKAKLTQAFKKLRAKGLSKLDSIEMSMEIAGVDLEKMGLDAKRSRMRIPTPGRRSKPTIADIGDMDYAEVTKNFTKEQRKEYLRKLA
jgi:hypothetical protein